MCPEATQYYSVCATRARKNWWHKIISELNLEHADTCLYLFRSRKKLLIGFFLLFNKLHRNFSRSEVSAASSSAQGWAYLGSVWIPSSTFCLPFPTLTGGPELLSHPPPVNYHSFLLRKRCLLTRERAQWHRCPRVGRCVCVGAQGLAGMSSLVCRGLGMPPCFWHPLEDNKEKKSFPSSPPGKAR